MSIEDIGLPTKTKIIVEKLFSKHLKPSEDLMKPFVAEFLEKLSDKPTKENVERICSKLKAQHRIGCSKGDIREIYDKYYSHIPLPQP
jgi:hypothetical protein